jgi:hypothetical protein
MIDGIWQPNGHVVTDRRFGVGWSRRQKNTIWHNCDRQGIGIGHFMAGFFGT